MRRSQQTAPELSVTRPKAIHFYYKYKSLKMGHESFLKGA